MPDGPLKIFVSSRMAALASERDAITAVLDRMKFEGWLFERHAGARPGTIRRTHLEEIERADRV